MLEGEAGELYRLLQRHGSQLDVNRANHAGLTPLHHAVLSNNLDTVKLLLSAGDARVDSADQYGFTPLHTASACGYSPLVSLLVVFGADVYAPTAEAELPVDVAKDGATAALLHEAMLQRLHGELQTTAGKTYAGWRLSCWLAGALHWLVLAAFWVVTYLYSLARNTVIEHRHRTHKKT